MVYTFTLICSLKCPHKPPNGHLTHPAGVLLGHLLSLMMSTVRGKYPAPGYGHVNGVKEAQVRGHQHDMSEHDSHL